MTRPPTLRRLRGGFGALCLAACCPLGAGSPYLSSVGPPPLRFQAPFEGAQRPASLLAILGPLAPPEPPPPASLSPAAAEPADAGLPASEPPESVQPPTVANAASTAPPPVVAVPGELQPMMPATPLYSPQIILPLFQTATSNAVTPWVAAPVGFTPPQPPSPRPSTATFSTSP